MSQSGHTIVAPRPVVRVWQLVLFGALVLILAVMALIATLRPDLNPLGGSAPVYVNGSFGSDTRADYASSIDRRVAPQRSMSRS